MGHGGHVNRVELNGWLQGNRMRMQCIMYPQCTTTTQRQASPEDRRRLEKGGNTIGRPACASRLVSRESSSSVEETSDQ